ncbi:MAG: hypothetical protein ACRERC_02985 [Candidatus Binatia bacterium]
MRRPTFPAFRQLTDRPRRPVASLAFLALLLAACRGEPDTPDGQIRALVARAKSAAEEQDIAALRDMISERYDDAEDNDKRALTAIVAYHLMRNSSIHLFAQVSRIDLAEAGRAAAVVYVAMGARPIPSVDALGGLRADIYRFDLHLAEESPGDWKLLGAEWRPADLEDLR